MRMHYLTCETKQTAKYSKQINSPSYSKSALWLIAVNSTLWTACIAQSIPLLNVNKQICDLRAKEHSKCSPEPHKASGYRVSHPIISNWVRTYVAHAKRTLQAQSSLLMVKAPGSSSMARACIFLAWFRFTEPLSTKDRCQHRAILSEHVQPMVKLYVPSRQWFFFF